MGARAPMSLGNGMGGMQMGWQGDLLCSPDMLFSPGTTLLGASRSFPRPCCGLAAAVKAAATSSGLPLAPKASRT